MQGLYAGAVGNLMPAAKPTGDDSGIVVTVTDGWKENIFTVKEVLELDLT